MCKLLLMVNMIWSELTRETSYQQPCLGGTVLIRLRWKNYLKKRSVSWAWVPECIQMSNGAKQECTAFNLPEFDSIWPAVLHSHPTVMDCNLKLWAETNSAFLKFLLPGYFISKTRNITMIGNFYFYFITEIRIILMQ